MPELDDQQLLSDFAEKHSEAAFAALVARYVNLVYSTALRFTGNPHHAEEISQAVFIILARKAGRLGRKAVLSGWLYHTTRLTAANFVKGEIRRQRREQEAYMQSTLNGSDAAAWKEIAPLLDDAMGRLGEADRNAVVLRFFENKTAREVGAALKLTEAAAHKRVNRALEKLRKFFTRRGVTLSAAVIGGAVAANSVHAAPVSLAKTISAMALAKGAAAPITTLTLVKGALKIMAWTKAKTAIVIGTTAILGVVGTTTIVVKVVPAMRVAHLDALHNIQGTWEGTINLGRPGVNKGETSTSRVVVKISKGSGGYSATADAIDLGRGNIPLTIDYHYPSLRLEINPRAKFDGKVNPKSTRLTLNGLGVLTRTATPDTVPVPLTEADFAPQAGFDLQGYWKGTIGTNALPVDWKIAWQPDGSYRAELDDPMQGTLGQPATVSYQRPTVKLVLATHGGMFQGEINSDNTEMKGSWIRGGQSIPAVFKRADYQADHAQDALKDYSFHSKNDLQGHWKGTWILPWGKKVKVPIRLALDIAKLPDGSYSATLSNIDQFGQNDPMPPSEFNYSPPDLYMAWKWAGNTSFKGTLENGKIVGTWFQGGGGFPLVFERTND